MNLKDRYKFFKEHAGYIVGRRAECALSLARAERWMEGANIEPLIEWDDDPERGDATDENIEWYRVSIEYAGEFACVGSVGILGDDSYLRVVSAELADELIGTLTRRVA